MHLFTIALAFVALFCAISATKHPKTICYYESWAHFRDEDGKMNPKDIGNCCVYLFLY